MLLQGDGRSAQNLNFMAFETKQFSIHLYHYSAQMPCFGPIILPSSFSTVPFQGPYCLYSQTLQIFFSEMLYFMT